MTDFDSCYAAVSSRDRRFDGRLITGVLTTGIFCRPSCPARTPHRENVRFFASPAAAQDAGLRACRRCRPELAPDRPGWDPQADIAARALRLIDSGQGEDGVAALARRVHVSPRQLQRIMTGAFGAGPAALIRMRRVRLARMLVDQTDLPLARVAFAAGFGSVRQFNDAFRATFQTNPSALRRGSASPAVTGVSDPGVGRPAAGIELVARAPFDGDWVLRWVRMHAVPGRDEVGEDWYRRQTDQGPVTMRPTLAGVRIDVDLAQPDLDIRPAAALARQVFDLDADIDAVGEHLCTDPVIGSLLTAAPGLRIPGAPDPWEGPVRTVLGQQVSAAAANTFMARLANLSALPGIPPPRDLRSADLEPLIGLTRQRAGAVRALAAAVDDGLDLSPGADADTASQALLDLPGIGPWTAGSICLLTLRHPDSWPAGDLALRRALADLTGDTLSARDLDRTADAWRPWRGYAAMALWHHYLGPE